jgi:hypothetical protein
LQDLQESVQDNESGFVTLESKEWTEPDNWAGGLSVDCCACSPQLPNGEAFENWR